MQYEPFHAELTIDPKGRITLPVQLRMAMRASGTNQMVAVANEGDRGGISLFAQEDYREVLSSKTNTADPFDPYCREMLFLRSVVSTNHTLTIDGNGRVLVAPRLRLLADLEGKIFMFSMGSWIELWNTTRWQERHPQVVQQWLDNLLQPSLPSITPAGDGDYPSGIQP